MSDRPPRRPSHHRARDRDAPVRLTDLDRDVLERAARFRVITQNQLERLHPDIPRRTMRYRTRRLRKLGLLGVSRPYCESGSEPQHWWPTSRGTALARGEAPPRRGERRRPNELALRHHAALTELYVVLTTGAADAGLRLEFVRREHEARETFEGTRGRERAIAPDLLVALNDQDDRQLVAHVEIDLGTMSHARLRTKLEGYLAYTEQRAWRSLGPYQPALLFITTSRVRADTFLRGAAQLLGSKKWAPHTGELVLAVCARARDMSQVHTARCWRDTRHDRALTLGDILNAARAPYDRRLATQAAEERALEDERDRLVADPEHLRAHLREHDGLRRAIGDCLSREAGIALDLLAASDAPPNASERAALRDLGRQHLNHLPAAYPPPTLNDVDGEDLELLAAGYRRKQQRELETLTAAHGNGPHLRKARRDLGRHGLRTGRGMEALRHDAGRDARVAQEQHELRERYLAFREAEARRRSKGQGLTSRVLRGADTYLESIDIEYLRICDRCDELAFPDIRLSSTGHHGCEAPASCPFCRSRLIDLKGQ
jgi:hypothetical protein